MDSDSSKRPKRKVKFAPNLTARRAPPPVQPKIEKVNDGTDDDEDEEAVNAVLRHKLNERLGKRGPKVEKKSAVRVAFSHDAASSTSIRSFGKRREEKVERSERKSLEDSAGQIVDSLALTSGSHVEKSESSSNPVIASSRKVKKMYREPWDYENTYYPTVLPLRQPNSGDPEILDEEEFGEAAADLKYDEDAINTAKELGLLEESENLQMLFLQLPPNLPIDKQVVRSRKGKEKVGSSMTLEDARGNEKEAVGEASKQGSGLEALPAGYMGKMLVYKSGAVKLKLGDNLFDVSAGTKSTCDQDVTAINTVDKTCCTLGKIDKRAVVTPEIDSLLDKLHDSVLTQVKK